MAKSRLPSPSADGWRELRDPTRGVRRYRFDAAGRPREALLADGRRLVFARDAAGRLRRLEGDDGFFLAFDPPGAARAALRVADPAGVTEVALAGEATMLRRGAAALRFERDAAGRLRRVDLPGSTAPLLYRRGADGCRIGPANGPPTLTVLPAGRCLRFRLADAGGWDETISPRGLAITARDLDGEVLAAVEVAFDLLGRTTSRRWSDGGGEAFARDPAGRLSRWTRTNVGGAGGETREYRYRDGDLAAESGAAGVSERELLPGGRVRSLLRPDGTRVRYDYDAAGRRVGREENGRLTRYRYDLLGQLVAVERPDGARVEFGYDGLGRRVARRGVDGRRRHEHRDAEGRLWAVTDDGGHALHTFVWWGDRLIARIDGPVGDPAAELFLCDPDGTPLAVLRADGAGPLTIERLDAPPFGAVSAPARPALYGHLGDAETGLVHFGARDLDPELGLFLTPDPWHGGADDQRRLAGTSVAALARQAELPAVGSHPYALCQFDPAGRVDRDGHASVLRSLAHLVLAPTWGMPLTSVSLFFFLPLNVYLELIGAIWAIFGKHPWPHHSIFKAIGLAGSSRQGMFSFGLNGFLPRVVAGRGVESDRAITVGNVIWINRDELAILDRRRVLGLTDLAGPPDPAAGGAPLAGVPRFNADPTKESVLAVTGIDSASKRQVHVSYWTRGAGNTVVVLGGQLAFQDRPNPPGGNVSLGAVHLATALPPDFPASETPDTARPLEVREFLHSGTSKRARAVIEQTAWFALDLPADAGVRNGDVLEVAAPGASPPEPPTYPTIAEVISGKERKSAILRRPLSPRFVAGGLFRNLVVRRVVDGGAVAGSWALGADRFRLELAAPAAPASPNWAPALRADEVVKVTAAAPAPAPPPPPGTVAPPGETTAYAPVKSIALTLKLAPAPAALPAGAPLFLLRPQGSPARASVADPAGKPAELTFTGTVPFGVGDLLSVTVEGGNQTTTARVTAVAGQVLTVAPPLTPALTFAGPGRVRVQRHVDANPDRDKGGVNSQSGDEVVVAVDRSSLFSAGALVRVQSGGNSEIHRVEAVRKVGLVLADEVVGTAPFALARASLDPNLRLTGVRTAPAGRFLKWTGGDRPAAFGKHPRFLLGLQPLGPGGGRPVSELTAFYLQPDPADLPGLDRDARRTWLPQSVGGDDYFVLDTDLPMEAPSGGGAHLTWHTEPGNKERDLFVLQQSPQPFELREFEASGLARGGAGGRPLTAHPPEALVPVRPTIHDTHRRALIEHELHHSVQNAYWGPLMNALPLPGLAMVVGDFLAAGTADVPDWLQEVSRDGDGGPIDPSTQLSLVQWASFGGLMQLAWRYVILSPAFFSEEARREITSKDFGFWSKIFHPLWGFLLSKLPEVDPNAPAGERWGTALLHLLERATDLRSWTPFTGFVPTLLPDNARSFLEQGASRASGDLYSTILSANDRFNFHTHTRFVSDSTDADLRRSLGDAVRLMLYASYRTDRLSKVDHADRPGSPITYKQRVGEARPVRIAAPVAGGPSLFHPDLYEVITPAPTATLQIEGPPSNRTPVDFLLAGAGTQLVPTLRALVPMPPRVNRSLGFYFLPAAPGRYAITGFYDSAGTDGDAKTQEVTLTFDGEVRLGDEFVPWALPPAHPAPPAGPPLERFVTEVVPLRVKDHSIRGWELDVDRPAAVSPPLIVATELPDRTGWNLTLRRDLPAGAAPVRVRLYRVFKKDDPAFDLAYDDVPSLKGIRSYLDRDLWLPVRDFLIRVVDLPPLPAATIDSSQSFTLDLPLALPGPGAIAIVPGAGAPRDLPKTRRGAAPAFPRGERWELGPLPEPIEATVTFEVGVTFGTPPDTAERRFVLTVNPAIRLPTGDGSNLYEARVGHPLTLNIVGGSPPYTVEASGLPAGTTATIETGTTVRVTVATAPPADREAVITVTDSAGKRGRHRVTIKQT